MSDSIVNDIVVQENKIPATTESLSIYDMATRPDVDTEKLKMLIELKNQEEDRACKKEFDFHFSEMQKEFEPIDKSKKGYDYKYAPLALMVKTYSPIIAKHGFSFRWQESQLENNGKRITIIISGYGHTDNNTFFDLPKLEGTKAMNPVQVAGAMSTYGQRYTFKAAFGITEIDEDTDAQLNYEDGITYADQIKALRSCLNLDSISAMWKDIYKDLQSKTDREGLKVLKNEYIRLTDKLQSKNK